MMTNVIWLAGLALANFWLAGNLGSLGVPNNTVTPIPMQPWVADPIEERVVVNQGSGVIGPAIKPGELRMCDQPPDTQSVLRAMPRVARGIPGIYEEFRDDIEIATEKLVDRVDPPRFYPLIG